MLDIDGAAINAIIDIVMGRCLGGWRPGRGVKIAK